MPIIKVFVKCRIDAAVAAEIALQNYIKGLLKYLNIGSIPVTTNTLLNCFTNHGFKIINT